MKILRKIFLSIFALSTAIILLLTPLLFYSFNVNFYTSKVENQNLETIQNVYEFLKWKNQLNNMFTDNEKSHMQDVKEIFYIVFIVEILAFMFFLFLLMFYVFNKQSFYIVSWLLYGSWLTLITIILLYLLLIIDFEFLFRIFHEVFFPQGNWTFDWSSTLIKLFPWYFFQTLVTRFLFVCLLISWVIFWNSVYFKKIKKL